MSASTSHWDTTYAAKGDRVSWYQDDPRQSLALLLAAAQNLDSSIVDVGAGASRTAENLLLMGYSDLTVLDISEVALGRMQKRLGDSASKVSWIVADVTNWRPARRYDIWHDRAVFHFLTEAAAQDAYISSLKEGTKPGSSVIMATFAMTGPEKCSGLPVQRYSAASLAARLGEEFSLYAHAEERHVTPFDTTQDFTYAAFHRL